MTDSATPAPTLSRAMILLPVLVLLADLLFWRHAAGLSVALFALALFAAARIGRPRPLAVLTLIVAILPVVELVQPLSVTILALGLLASLAVQHQAPMTAALALAAQIPTRAARDLTLAGRGLLGQDPGRQGRRILRAWSLPLGGLLLLTALLAKANPVLDNWLHHLANQRIDPGVWIQRGLFWSGTALIAWPLLTVRPTRPGPWVAALPNPERLGVNAASVANALVLFNVALAVQTVLDARYLWTFVMPPGMSHAAYAHRGAYPLLATALLAGAFALAARPFVTSRPLLKPLLCLWLGQNALLSLSALYRLVLYIQTYGLTYLRVHAAIWMALVAAGLTLTLWQVARNHSAVWLLLRSALLGAVALYVAAFVNFADVIAETNLRRNKIDRLYLCQLGPTAAASVPKWAWRVESPGDDGFRVPCTLTPPQITDWRDWGFRNWRVLRTLHQQEQAHEDPRRR